MSELPLQDSTNVYSVDECAVDGWYDEPIGFKARKNLDLVVQIWAYRYLFLEHLFDPIHLVIHKYGYTDIDSAIFRTVVLDIQDHNVSH